MSVNLSGFGLQCQNIALALVKYKRGDSEPRVGVESRMKGEGGG